MRMLRSALLGLVAGCAHPVRPVQLPNRTDTTLVVMADSMLGGTFPQFTDSARARSRGSMLAAPDAPLCSLDLKSSTVGWEEVQTPIQSRYLKSVALRLPPGFKSAWYSHPRDPGEEDSEELADSSKHWGHMLGSWDRFVEGPPYTRPEGFTVWIGPNEGYPSSYVGGAEVRQVALTECSVESGLGVVPVALFTVESPESMIGTQYYVVTYATIQAGVYITAMGTALDSGSQTSLLSSISTIRVLR